MKHSMKWLAAATLMLAIASLSSCSDNKSYAEQLEDERRACNAYLAQFEVINEIPADTVFRTGPDAPFYRIDPDGNVYMQVLKPGDRKNDRAKTSETIYVRYTRYNLTYWYTQDHTWVGNGNADDMSLGACYLKYNDFSLPASSQWGYGLQLPLGLLGVNCEVNLVIKSQFGLAEEISYVTPFMYHVRYFHSQI